MTELKFVICVDIPDILEQFYNDSSEKHKGLLVKTLTAEMNYRCQRILNDFVDDLQHRPEICLGYGDHHA